jgi:hypothetical protein
MIPSPLLVVRRGEGFIKSNFGKNKLTIKTQLTKLVFDLKIGED